MPPAPAPTPPPALISAPAPPPLVPVSSLPPPLLHVLPPAAPLHARLQHLTLTFGKPSDIHGALKLNQLLPDLDEAKVKFPTEVIGQSTVVVVDSQVGRTHLADAKLLLLVTGGRHRVPVVLLSFCLVLSDFLDLLHKLDAALDVPLGAHQLGRRKFFTNLLGKVVDTVCFPRHLVAERLLGLRQFFLCLLRFSVAVGDKGGEMVARVHVVKVIVKLLGGLEVCSERKVVDS